VAGVEPPTRKAMNQRAGTMTMGRFENSIFATTGNAAAQTTVSFIQKLTTSESFRAFFKEGMALVEESAAYLDGAGREDSRRLRRPVALAYATESMRLTTRLMQIASWLLLQRAVNEGELTPAQAASEKHRVRLTRQDIACAQELFDELPAQLRRLTFKSMRLQDRVMHFDQSLDAARAPELPIAPSAVARQVEQLRIAFAH
jgi:regulator of CtrA degradation